MLSGYQRQVRCGALYHPADEPYRQTDRRYYTDSVNRNNLSMRVFLARAIVGDSLANMGGFYMYTDEAYCIGHRLVWRP